MRSQSGNHTSDDGGSSGGEGNSSPSPSPSTAAVSAAAEGEWRQLLPVRWADPSIGPAGGGTASWRQLTITDYPDESTSTRTITVYHALVVRQLRLTTLICLCPLRNIFSPQATSPSAPPAHISRASLSSFALCVSSVDLRWPTSSPTSCYSCIWF
jgi:hypothetical protein